MSMCAELPCSNGPEDATPISAALDNLDQICIQRRIATQLIEPYASKPYHFKLLSFSILHRNFSKKK